MDSGWSPISVMPGLVSGIHDFDIKDKDVDGRDKPGHDGVNALARS
jgi:hypothetical protein